MPPVGGSTEATLGVVSSSFVSAMVCTGSASLAVGCCESRRGSRRMSRCLDV